MIGEEVRISMISREIVARHHSHSLSKEPWTIMISWLEFAAKHHSHSPTRVSMIGIISRLEFAAKCHSHSPTRVPRIGTISRLELQQGTTVTHSLESQGQA